MGGAAGIGHAPLGDAGLLPVLHGGGRMEKRRPLRGSEGLGQSTSRPSVGQASNPSRKFLLNSPVFSFH